MNNIFVKKQTYSRSMAAVRLTEEKKGVVEEKRVVEEKKSAVEEKKSAVEEKKVVVEEKKGRQIVVKVTLEKEEALQKKYGDAFLYVVKEGEKEIGYITPIDFAVTLPSSSLLEEQRDRITINNTVEFKWKDVTVLVYRCANDQTRNVRMEWMWDHYPYLAYLESNKSKASKKLLLQSIETSMREYRSTPKIRMGSIPINQTYTDIIDRENKLSEKLGKMDEAGKIDELNDYLTVKGRIQQIPNPTFKNYLALISFQTIMMSEPYYKYIAHSSLIPFSSQILAISTAYMQASEKLDFFYRDKIERFIEMLSIETNRLLDTETPITEDSHVIIPHFAAQNLYKTYYVSPYEALNGYVGGVLEELDLSKTYITGSAIACALGYQSSKCDPNIKVLYPNYYISASEEKGKIRVEDTGEVFKGKNNIGHITPGADIDMMVCSKVDDKEFDAIAEKHFQVFKAVWRECTMNKIIKKNGYNYHITSDAADFKRGFREVEIYRGSLNHIASHHVPPVRGWFHRDGSNKEDKGQLYLEASALHCQMVRGSYSSYHYFAGTKSTPTDVIAKYERRGYRLGGLPDPYQRVLNGIRAKMVSPFVVKRKSKKQ